MENNKLFQYAHVPENEDLGIPERSYQAREERLEYKGKEVLFLMVESTGFTMCDRSINYLRTGRILGYINRWKHGANEKGEVVSDIEPIEDEEERRELRKIMKDQYMLNVYY